MSYARSKTERREGVLNLTLKGQLHSSKGHHNMDVDITLKVASLTDHGSKGQDTARQYAGRQQGRIPRRKPREIPCSEFGFFPAIGLFGLPVVGGQGLSSVGEGWTG